MASGVEKQSPNHRILKSKEKTEGKIPNFWDNLAEESLHVCLTLNDSYYMPKLISKENSDGQLFPIKSLLVE